MADLGDAVNGRGREQRGLCARNRRLVEVHRRALQAVRRLEHMVGTLADDARPSPAAPRGASRSCVAPGNRRPAARCARGRARASSGPSSSTEPRSRPTSVRSGSCVRTCRRPHAQRRRADALDFGADVEQQPRHHLDVADARHVGQHALVVGQQAGGQQRQRGVLVAFDGDAAFEPVCRLRSAEWTCLFQDLGYDCLANVDSMMVISGPRVRHVRIRLETDEHRLRTQRRCRSAPAPRA